MKYAFYQFAMVKYLGISNYFIFFHLFFCNKLRQKEKNLTKILVQKQDFDQGRGEKSPFSGRNTQHLSVRLY